MYYKKCEKVLKIVKFFNKVKNCRACAAAPPVLSSEQGFKAQAVIVLIGVYK